MNFLLFPVNFFLIPLLILSSCERDLPLNPTLISSDTIKYNYKTKNVILVVIDGPRYSETWGDSTRQFIPNISKYLQKEGCVFTNFYNTGPTYTNAGYTSICTGNYQEIDNTGMEFPQYPSLFQNWLKKNGNKANSAWIISSKGKLKILTDCTLNEWKGKYNPAFNGGVDGVGNGYREDSITYSVAIEILKQHHPSLAIIGFREPDFSAHQGNWNGYLEGIIKTDEYVLKLWDFLKNDSFYKSTTALIVTNDHGRHLYGVNGGFANHGDDCDGCRHINLIMAGPDFHQNKIIPNQFNQRDISATISELLDFEMATGKGKVIREALK